MAEGVVDPGEQENRRLGVLAIGDALQQKHTARRWGFVQACHVRHAHPARICCYLR